MNANEIENAVDAYLREIGVTYAATLSEKGHDKGGWECDAWRATFSRGGSAFSCPYYTGIGLRARAASKPVPPQAASVLYVLLRDVEAADMSFPNWCGELGHDEYSRKAFDTYMQCCDTARELRAVFTRGELARLDNMVQEY